MRLRGLRGLTLVEILVVIVTMAVLMAILFPLAQSAYTSAHRSACMTNMQNLAQAVAGYQQDNLTYPDEPNFVGIRGIQQGGLSGMTLVDPGITANDLWCADDPYPQEFGTMGDDPEVYHLTRDNLGSTYDVNYNYYGFVTTTTGLPFPITSREALVYLVGDPRKVAYENTYNYVFESNRAAYLAAGKTTAQAETLAASDAAPIAETAWSGFNNIFHITEPAKPTPPVSGDPNYATLYAQWLRDVQTWQTQVSVFPWDLGLVNPDLMYSLQKKGSIGTYDAKNNNVHVGDTFSKGMYPALCNVRAPKNTIIAFCPHHPTDNPTVLPVVTLAGEANFVKPIMPRNFYAGDVYNTVPPTATAPNLPTPFSVATRRNANAQFQASIPAASIKRFTAPIDWRLNKDTLTPHNGGTTNNAILDPPQRRVEHAAGADLPPRCQRGTGNQPRDGYLRLRLVRHRRGGGRGRYRAGGGEGEVGMGHEHLQRRAPRPRRKRRSVDEPVEPRAPLGRRAHGRQRRRPVCQAAAGHEGAQKSARQQHRHAALQRRRRPGGRAGHHQQPARYHHR